MPNFEDSLPPSSQTLQRAFEALVTTLNDRGVRYAIIGGIALIQHTRVRTTDDIDVLLLVPQIAMPSLFEALKDRGFDVDVERNIREFRDGLTVLRFETTSVDLMPPLLPVYSHVLDRAIEGQVLGQQVRISSAEGLIVMKLIAMRPQDEADIQELLAAYADKLDLNFIRAESLTCMAADDPRLAKFDAWVANRST